MVAVLGLVSLAASGCGAEDHRSADFYGRIVVGGGRELYLECRGEGSPVVILVSGLRGAADLWSQDTPSGRTVFADVASTTRVCAYDRPGTPTSTGQFSRSDAVTQPTTAKDAVADLNALLQRAEVPGPYVLAGHSYGGMVARLFASTRPNEVAGMVLIDALSEFFRDGWSAADWEQWKRANALPPETLAEYPAVEQVDVEAAMDQLRAAAPIQPMPLVVVSADVRYGPGWADRIAAGDVLADTPADLGGLIDRAQQHSQEAQAGLVPGARHVIDTESGHNMMIDQPTLVTAAIVDVVGAVRAERPTAS
jgi:pimeloyl-ACP methyl ester carboxylesterase